MRVADASRALGAVGLAILVAGAVIARDEAPVSATDPAHAYGIYKVSGAVGCMADVHHATNLFGYATAWTDNPRKPSWVASYGCDRSAADVFYPFLQKTTSGWGYFNSSSASPYQASPTYSEHNVCLSTGPCYAPPMYGLP
jgi:hypothetical protein